MSFFSVSPVTSPTDGQTIMNEKSAISGELRPRRSLKALQKIPGLSVKRPRVNISTSGMVARGWVFSSRDGPHHAKPHEDFDEWTLVVRRGIDGIEPRQVPPPPHLSPLEEKCRRDERFSPQEADKILIRPRARCVFGDLHAPWVYPDIRDEVYADYSLFYMNEEAVASHRAHKESWDADKARGVHYPSVLQVRRNELTSALQNVAPDLHENREVEVEQKQCRRCAEPLKAVPPGLNRTDWLPLLYLRRARRCERQKPNPSEAERARAIILGRALNGNESRLATWTSRSGRHFVRQPSPLSGRPRQTRRKVAAEYLNLDSLFIDTGESDNEELDSEAPYEEFEDSSSSASVYSQETNPTSENVNVQLRPGVYRPVEVPEVPWVKTFRVPQFTPTTGYSRWTLAPVDEVVAKTIPEENVVEERESPSTRCDVNKPLPPLPPPD